MSFDPASTPSANLAGQVIAEKYELVRLLGQGGMGAVFEGRNRMTLKRCAVKLLISNDLTGNPEIMKRFFREARAGSVVESDHIVEVYDSGVDARGFPYMVMEYLNGEDLEHTLRREGALSPLSAGKVILQAATGLARAHEQGIVHRDIKPANLYLTRRDNGEIVVKLLDFGIAKVKMDSFHETSPGLTRTGSMLGTPLYMSPDQIKRASDIDASSDVWSLGVVLFECLSGQLPWGNVDSLGELMAAILTHEIPLLQNLAPWVPPELAEIVHRAISRDASRRIRSGAELRDLLAQIVPDGDRLTPETLVGVPVEQRAFVAPRLEMSDDGMLRATARTGLSVTQAAPKKAKSSSAPAFAALAALAVLGVGGVAAWKMRRTTPSAESTVASASAAQPSAEMHFPLGVKPDGVEVLVDRQLMTVIDGKVDIGGAPGSVHSVRLSLGGKILEQNVVVSSSGLLPAELSLLASGPAVAPAVDATPLGAAAPAAAVAASPAAGARPAPGKKGAAAPAPGNEKPEAPKPKPAAKATGLSEKTDEF